MKLRSLVLGVLTGLLASRTAWAATGPDAAAASLAGEWVLTTTIFGSVAGERLKLSVDQGKITGSIYQRKDVPLTGTVEGDRVRFEIKDQDGSTSAYDGRIKDGLLSGTVTFSNEPWGATPPATWRARRAAADKPAAPRTLDFEPKEFHRVFSSTIEPVLRIWPGDTVRTRTVDAGGVDEKAKSRSLGGNPQTGPFYVEGAMPGDVLVVHVRKLRLNRPTAISDDGFVDRALTTDYASSTRTTISTTSSGTWISSRAWRGPPSRPTTSRIWPCRCGRCSAASAWRPASVRRPSGPATRGGSAATWISTRSARARRCTSRSRSRARCSTSATATPSRATAS